MSGEAGTADIAGGIEAVCRGLRSQDWVVVPDFLDAATCTQLVSEIQGLQATGQMRPAGVGRGEQLQVALSIRSDFIYWLGDEAMTPAQEKAWGKMAELQASLNRSLFLGLTSFEGHLTVYPPGGAYAKHVDNFRGTSARVLSCIIYLTPDYKQGDGGQLRIYASSLATSKTSDIEPRGGTLVCFMSQDVPHEVLATKETRYSLTGWFRR